MSNASGRPAFDSNIDFLDSTYFAPPFAHTPPTTAHFRFASPLYSGLSFGTRTKASSSSIFEIYY